MKVSMLRSCVQPFNKVGLMAASLFTFFVCIPLDTAQVFGQFSILRFVALLPIVVGILNVKRLRIRNNPAGIFLALYVTLMAITLPYSYSIESSTIEFTTYLMYAVLVFFATSFEYNNREKNLIMAGLIGSSVMAIVLLIFFPFDYQGRLTILVNPIMNEDPNHFSGYLIPGLLFMIYGLFRWGKVRIFAVLGLMVFIYVLLLTGSRGGALATIIGSVVLIWSETRRLSHTVLSAVVKTVSVAVILIAVVSSLAIYSSSDVVERFTIESVVDTGGTGREDIWRESLDLWSQAPIIRQMFGYGAGSIESMTGVVAHSNWVEVIFEMGAIGLMIYTLIMASVLYMLFKSHSILGLAIFSAFIGLTLSLSLFSYKPIWAILIIAIVFYTTRERKVKAYRGGIA